MTLGVFLVKSKIVCMNVSQALSVHFSYAYFAYSF